MVGVALGGCSGCGCACSCCTENPSSWSVAFSSNWGTDNAAHFPCVICANMGGASYPSPVILTLGTSTLWPDFGANSDSYVRLSFRCMGITGVLIGPTGCQVNVLAGLYRDPAESGCRLVVRFYDAVVGRTVTYRSPVITDCCAELTLDRYSVADGFNFSICSLPPSTITVTPICVTGDCIYQGDGAGGWTLIDAGDCVGPCAPPAGSSSGTGDVQNGTCGGGEGEGP